MAQLRFLADLKKNGRYEHWGLEKTYGEEKAKEAMACTHSASFNKVLEAPLLELDQEEKEAEAKAEGTGAEQADDLIPPQKKGGSARHLKWILKVLSLSGRSR